MMDAWDVRGEKAALRTVPRTPTQYTPTRTTLTINSIVMLPGLQYC